MKVLFLGAGASRDAGYPLASTLMDDLKKSYDSGVDGRSRSVYWDRFVDFRDRAPEGIREILDCGNIEIALSLLDLYRFAREYKHDMWLWQMMRARMGQEEIPTEHPVCSESPLFGDMSDALRNLKLCIDSYFLTKHPEMFTAQQDKCLWPIGKIISRLSAGDAIVTTNWDALPEIALKRQELWSPVSGYGVRITLEPNPTPRGEKPRISEDSPVKVLKLHGSVGWMRSAEFDARWFLGREFLMWFTRGFRDAREVPSRSSGVMIYPTMFKQFEQEPFRQIWQLAADALLAADKICVIGYSLPAGDVAVRALIHATRSRLERKEIAFTVIDPEQSTLDRWGQLMGLNARLKKMRLGEYSMNEEILDATL